MMASNHPATPDPMRTMISPLDRVSCKSDLLKDIPPAKLAVTVLLVTMCRAEDKHAALYHCEVYQQRRTFIKGMWGDLGLDDPNEEREYIELRDKPLRQALLSYGSAYVLTDCGKLYTMGANQFSQLGLGAADTYMEYFANVNISEHILSISCGSRHCLVTTSTKVFAFGCNVDGRAGVPTAQTKEVSQPKEIYTGTGGNAPLQVETGDQHSAILTQEGQVLTFGWSRHGNTGHGDAQEIDKPTPLELINERVQQIGCTISATYFLLMNGVMLGCGWNDRSRLGVGHGNQVCIPSPIETRGHKIKSFRCTLALVIAITLPEEVLVWGLCRDGTAQGRVITVPQLVETLEHPRDVFAWGWDTDTGGSVYPENSLLWRNDIESLTFQLTELKQKMAPLASQLVTVKMKMLDADEEDEEEDESSAMWASAREYAQSATRPISDGEYGQLLARRGSVGADDYSVAKRTSAGKSGNPVARSASAGAYDHKKKQLLGPSSLAVENVSLPPSYKAIEGKHVDLMEKSDKKKNERESLVAFAKSPNQKSQHTQLRRLRRDRQALQTRLQNSKTTTISISVLLFVAEKIGRDWLALSVKLEVGHEVLDNIEASCWNLPYRTLAVLYEWYQRDPEYATKEVLVKALRDCHRNDIADKISQMQ